MTNIVYLLILLISNVTYASLNAELLFKDNQVKQGRIEEGVLRIDFVNSQKISWQSLKGKKIGETIYLFEIEPFVKQQGQDYLETNVKVVFVKIPENNIVTDKDMPERLVIKLNDLRIIPSESKEFVYEKFSVPEELKILYPLVVLLFLIVTGLFSRQWIKKYKKSKAHKRYIQNLKEELLKADSCDEVVSVWIRKNEYLTTFPTIAQSFRKMEADLFKYLFKPKLEELEKKQIEEAYRDFREQVQGILDGV